MTSEERKHRIEVYLQRVEFASLDELSRHVDASVSTVRRDLTALEATGNLRRTHGGVRLVTPKSDEFAFNVRDAHQILEKEAIRQEPAVRSLTQIKVSFLTRVQPFIMLRGISKEKPCKW